MLKSQDTLIKNTFYKFGLTFFKMVLPILVTPYVYRQITPEDMGIIGYVITVVTYFYILGDFGYFIYSFRETILLRDKPDELNRFFNSTFFIRTIINSVSLLFYLVFVFYFIEDDIPIAMYAVAGIHLVGTFFNVEGFFEGLEQFKFITVKTILIRTVFVVCIFLFIKSSNDQSALYYLLIVSTFIFVNNIVSFIYLLRSKMFYIERPSKLKLWYHIKKMAFIFVTINASMFFLQFDKLVLGIKEDFVDLSYYGLSEKITLIVTSIFFSLITVVTPNLGGSLVKDRSVYIQKLKRVLNAVVLFLVPIVFVLIASSREVIHIIGGQEYEDSVLLFCVFSVYIIAYTFLDVYKTNIFILEKKESVYFFSIVMFFLFNVLVKLVFIHSLNVYHFTALSVLSSFLILLFLFIYTKQKMGFYVFTPRFVFYLIVALPIFLVGFIEHNSEVVSLLLKGTTAAIYYLGVLLVFKDQTFREIIEKVVNR